MLRHFLFLPMLFTHFVNIAQAKNDLPYLPDVEEEQEYIVLQKNVAYFGHSISLYEGNQKRRSEAATRKLVELATAYNVIKVGISARPLRVDSDYQDWFYISREETDIEVSSQGGHHNLLFPHLKNIFIVGGKTDRCLCEGIRDIVKGIEISRNNDEINIYLVRDGIYAEYPIFANLTPENAIETVKTLFIPSFNCPNQDYKIKRNKRPRLNFTKLKLFHDRQYLADFDLEPGDDIALNQTTKTINLRIIKSDDLESYFQSLQD